MVSQRRRANNSLGNYLNNLDQKVEEARNSSPALQTGAVGPGALRDGSVGADALAPEAVTSAALGRGAVGTENLGVVSRITSDSGLDLFTATGVSLTGDTYPPPVSGAVPLALNSSNVVVMLDPYPLGIIAPFAVAAAPTGWLSCDGSSVSRTTYAALFSLLGTLYGAGDGTTTFGLPNYTGRVLVGLDPAQTEFDVIGEAGGSKTHTLTVGEMPSHTHVQNSHGHTVPSATSTGGATGFATGTVSGSSAGVDGTVAVNQSTGGGGAHNNLQPYRVVHYIIKAL